MVSKRASVSAIAPWKMKSTVCSAGTRNPNSAMPERFSKQPAKEGSQLIKIVGAGHVDVVSGCQFGALLDAGEAEDHERKLLAQSGVLADSRDDWKGLINIKSQTDENQIRMVKAGFQDRFRLIPGSIHLKAAG